MMKQSRIKAAKWRFRPYFDTRPDYGRSVRNLLKEVNESMMDRGRVSRLAPLNAAIILFSVAACATVKVQAPDKPIEINLNVKIDQEVRIKMDKEVEDLIANNPNIF
ncbi:MAG: YnbE family lipoprotein [Parvularculaceae bacterium]